MAIHPIQPSPELVEQCMEMFRSGTRMEAMCELAFQAGADAELEACCEWLEINYDTPRAGHPLRLGRRPKPLSLKEQALALLYEWSVFGLGGGEEDDLNADIDTIRKALEALSD